MKSCGTCFYWTHDNLKRTICAYLYDNHIPFWCTRQIANTLKNDGKDCPAWTEKEKS